MRLQSASFILGAALLALTAAAGAQSIPATSIGTGTHTTSTDSPQGQGGGVTGVTRVTTDDPGCKACGRRIHTPNPACPDDPAALRAYNAQANAYNAEGAQLDAEAVQLNAAGARLNTEADQLDGVPFAGGLFVVGLFDAPPGRALTL